MAEAPVDSTRHPVITVNAALFLIRPCFQQISLDYFEDVPIEPTRKRTLALIATAIRYTLSNTDHFRVLHGEYTMNRTLHSARSHN